MNESSFSIKESLIYGWEAFLAHYSVFVPVVFLSVAISFASEFITKHEFGILGYLAIMLGVIAQIIMGMGITKIALKITAGESVVFDDVFSQTHLFFLYIGGNIVYGLIVCVGLLLFIVPGFIWMVSYWFFPYVLIDKELGVWVALSEAKRISKDVRWELFKFMMVMGALNIAGVLTFFVGLFITIPITAVATAHVYRQLVNKQKATV